MPGSLQKVADFFQRHPEVDLVMGNGKKIDGEGNHLKDIKARNFSVHRYLHGGTRWLQQSTFFKRETYLSSPKFNLDNRTCWDGELLVNLVNQGAKVGYINSDLSAFRIHNTSISGSGRMMDAYLRDCNRIFRQLKGHDWGRTDEMWKIIYRAEGLILRVGEWFENSATRHTG
jgi:hypothetical protein